MTIRKRRNPTPSFQLPPPYQPMAGIRAPLQVPGVFPYCSMMQVAAEDTHVNYVICRGFDVRINRFIDYEAGNENKPGIPVAKPYGSRKVGAYQIAQIFAAVLPLQSTNPSPATVEWRVGQNPGVAETTEGHPASLSEKVDELKTDEEKFINWMFLEGSSDGLYWCMLDEDHPGKDICFNIIIGEWDPSTNGWTFDCNADPEKGVDFHEGAPEPARYACGWFEKKPSDTTTSGSIYVCVSLDCTSRGSCADQTPSGCG